jgi:hypothetical protein
VINAVILARFVSMLNIRPCGAVYEAYI